jgi:general secretion pathway protein A
MYLNYYNLKAKPFSISPDPKFLWLGEKHAEALASLKYGIREKKGFFLLTCEIGTGKTLLINCLVKSINEDVIVATIPDPSLKLIDFYNILSNKFKISRKFKSKGDFLIYFEKFLISAHEERKKVLLIIDEAQRLKSDLLDEIRVLSNIEFENKKLINIFFVGQRELKEMLLEERNRPLKQRITNNYHLMPLTEIETSDFILHRLKIAGATQNIFMKEAIREIHNFSQGVPRLINIICDHSLLTGYSKSITMIDIDVIKECGEELQISANKSFTPIEQPTYTEVDPLSNEQEIIPYLKRPKPYERPLIPPKATKYSQLFKPSEKLSNIKVAVIASTILLLGMVAIFFNSRFAESGNLIKEENEISKLEDATTNSKPPFMIAKSNDDTKDALPEISLSNRIQEENNAERINIAKDLTINKIEELMEKTVSTNEISEDDMHSNKSLEVQKFIGKHIRNEHKKKVDHNFKPIDREQFLSFTEQKFLIHFKPNSANLDILAFEMLNKVVDTIYMNPNLEITIEGYSDSYGDYVFNKHLSQSRADMIKSYLIGKGIDFSRITAIGFGPDKPIADNLTWEGRQKNRRVEIKIKTKSNGG